MKRSRADFRFPVVTMATIVKLEASHRTKLYDFPSRTPKYPGLGMFLQAVRIGDDRVLEYWFETIPDIYHLSVIMASLSERLALEKDALGEKLFALFHRGLRRCFVASSPAVASVRDDSSSPVVASVRDDSSSPVVASVRDDSSSPVVAEPLTGEDHDRKKNANHRLLPVIASLFQDSPHFGSLLLEDLTSKPLWPREALYGCCRGGHLELFEKVYRLLGKHRAKFLKRLLSIAIWSRHETMYYRLTELILIDQEAWLLDYTRESMCRSDWERYLNWYNRPHINQSLRDLFRDFMVSMPRLT